MYFENTTNGHNKFYEVNMIESDVDGKWLVIARSGARTTSWPKKHIKATGDFYKCQKVFTKIIKLRHKHGYTKVDKPER